MLKYVRAVWFGGWINVASTSVFAPFTEITAEEFRRVTEVSCLGFIHGTMAAGARMKPRDHGTTVQMPAVNPLPFSWVRSRLPAAAVLTGTGIALAAQAARRRRPGTRGRR